jgi:ABC-type transport system substrate-binding protein
LDKSRRKELYGELSRVIADDQPFDFLAFQHANIGFDKRVAGIDPGINMGYNYHKWFFK